MIQKMRTTNLKKTATKIKIKTKQTTGTTNESQFTLLHERKDTE